MIKVIGGAVSFNGKILEVGTEFTSTEEHEKRLVEQGFAVYVNGKKQQPQPKNDDLGNGEQGNGQDGDEDEEFDEEKAKKLTVDQLKALANTYGISEEEMVLENGKNKTKAEIIELIKGSIDSQADEEGLDLGNGEQGIA